jgi:glycosyltransferase involved in cell wall biosynthesis
MTSNPPVLSVVIPCLNAGQELGVQLAALSAQEISYPWELIVVDNGSTDDTTSVAESFRDRLPSLTVVAEPTRGRQNACNRGAAAARGQALVFVDADDEAQPGFLSAMAEALAQHAMVGGRLNNAKLASEGALRHGNDISDAILDGYGFLPFASGACTGIQAEVFRQVGGFEADADYCEDVALSWRVQLAGFDLVPAPKAVMAYRQRSTYRLMFRQHRNYGKARVWLFKTFGEDGMQRRPASEVARDWGRLLMAVPRLRDPVVRVRWVRRLGRSVGFIAGTLRYRCVYL